MAAGDSATSICNIGLIDGLGEPPLTDLSDNRKAAIVCRSRYDSIRREILESYVWNCGTKQAQLAAAPAAPLFTFANAYPLPPDFIRMVDLPENDQAVWKVMSMPSGVTALFTDEGSPLNVLYGWDLIDPTKFSPLLSAVIGLAVGFSICEAITGSTAKQRNILQLIEGKLNTARLANSQQNSSEEWDVDVWLRHRA